MQRENWALRDTQGDAQVSVQPNDLARLDLRTPVVVPMGAHMAVLGAGEVHGRGARRTFGDVVAASAGVPVLNLGLPNAGPDVFLGHPALIACAGAAQMTFVQVMGAQNLSNRYYRVHPRRNDRFLKPSTALLRLFPDIDLSEVHFTRHLLRTLYRANPRHFAVVRAELQRAWQARMTTLLGQLRPPVVLLWCASQPPDTEQDIATADPLFVTGDMLDSLTCHAAGLLLLRDGRLADDRAGAGGAFDAAAHEQMGQQIIAWLARQNGAGGTRSAP